jgi:hypothetical protein
VSWRWLARQISDHDFDLEKPRRFFPNDCLHATVMLVDGIHGRLHNNPPMKLWRLNDEGAFVEELGV